MDHTALSACLRDLLRVLLISMLWIWSSVAMAGKAGRNIPVTSTTVHPAASDAQRIPQVDQVNSLYCTMERVPVICLIDRSIKYIFPFECMLNRTSRRFLSPKLLLAYAPDPVHLLPVPAFPLAVDHWIQDERVKQQDNIIDSCPCNCEIDCRSPVSRMYEIRITTQCHDCKCLSDSGIGCECYDKYDLMFKDVDPYMTYVLSKHAARNSKTISSEEPADGRDSYVVRSEVVK